MRTVITILFLIIFFTLSLIMLPLVWLVRKISPAAADNMAHAIVRFTLNVIRFLSGCKITIVGRENIPDCPVLFTPNHSGLWDIVAGFSIMDGLNGRHTTIIAKKEFSKIPLFAHWIRAVGCRFIDRENVREGLKVILDSAEDMKAGKNVLIFPEGTRSRTGELLEFKGGSFKIADKSGYPVIPVAITNTSCVLEQHFPWIKAHPITFTFCEPIHMSEMPRSEKKFVAQNVRATIAGVLGLDPALPAKTGEETGARTAKAGAGASASAAAADSKPAEAAAADSKPAEAVTETAKTE